MAVNSVSQTITNDVTSVNSVNSTYSSKAKNTTTEADKAETSAAAVYEKSENTTKNNKTDATHKYDKATVDKMMADAEERNQQLRSLVEKMLLKQGKTLSASDNIYNMLRTGQLNVDPETSAQAKKDIAEDGYWGVKQTSERMVSFAKALAGDNPEKADELIAAVKKGFSQAEKAWGGKLPSICQETIDKTISDLESWRDETKVK